MRIKINTKNVLIAITAAVALVFLGVYFGQAQTANNKTKSLVNKKTVAANQVLCTEFKYSDWGECINGQQGRLIVSRQPASCVGGNYEALERACCVADEWACQWSSQCLEGQQITDCKMIKDCPGVDTPAPIETRSCSVAELPPCQYLVSWSGICEDGLEYQRIEKKYPTACQEKSVVLESRACTASSPDVVSPKDCGDEAWTCSAWQPAQCSTGAKRQRSCSLRPECLPSTSKPTEVELCPNLAQADNRPSCEYVYSDWSSCLNGRRSRKLLGVKNEDCVKTTAAVLVENCAAEAKCLEDEWSCSDWGLCNKNGIQERACVLKFDCPGLVSDKPLLKQNCGATTKEVVDIVEPVLKTDAEKTQSLAKSKLSDTENSQSVIVAAVPDRSLAIINQTVSSSATTSLNSTTTASSSTKPLLNLAGQTSADLNRQLPNVCLEAGYKELSDCELYLRRVDIARECLANGQADKNTCRQYLLEHYGRPVKCQTLSEDQCQLLIDNLILSDFNTQQQLSDKQKTLLAQVVNKAAVINTANQSLIVQPVAGLEEAGSVTEIKLNSLPLKADTSSLEVRLVAAQLSAEQQRLAPVLLVIDTDADGLADDTEKRLGSDPQRADTDGDGYNDGVEIKTNNDPLKANNKQTAALAPIDQALVAGLALEQPKYRNLPLADFSSAQVETITNNGKSLLRFSGTAKANQVLSLYLYSQLPILATVKTDNYGNWVYDLEASLADGQHEVYVAFNDNQGKIESAASPTVFLVKEAKVVTVDDFIQTNNNSVTQNQTKGRAMFYLTAAVALILAAGTIVLWLKRGVKK